MIDGMHRQRVVKMIDGMHRQKVVKHGRSEVKFGHVDVTNSAHHMPEVRQQQSQI